MKNILTFLGCSLFLMSCGGSGNSEYEDYYDADKRAAATQEAAAPVEQTKVGADAALNELTDSAVATGEQVQAQNYEQGAKLIAMSDCLSCHQENQKIVGPSYVDVAQKYEFNDKNVDYLAGKIIEGGAGVWGQVPMTPHPDLEKEDARTMARYILSLRKK